MQTKSLLSEAALAVSRQGINTTLISENDKHPRAHLNHYEKRRSPMQIHSSNKSVLLEGEPEASVTSFSFAVSPSQKPLFIQAVYTSMLVRHLVSAWE